jgi:hypothetical protein
MEAVRPSETSEHSSTTQRSTQKKAARSVVFEDRAERIIRHEEE